MRKDEIKVGQVYQMKHSSERIKVRITGEKPVLHRGHWTGDNRRGMHWTGINLSTGRVIEIKSAVKLSVV